MALKMALRWKNPDSSADINLRAKGVFAKGFVTGGSIVPSLLSLQVDVEPFVLMTFDGAVVTSDANETLTVADGQINYVVCRARYREGDTEIKAMQVLTEAQYLADAEFDHLHVAGVVDLSAGGPYAFPPISRVFYENRDTVDQQTRSAWREPVDSFGSLPTGDANFNRDGDVRVTLDTGSLYVWNESLSVWDPFAEVPLVAHRDTEHTNGITGQSDATTLQPDINGTNMRIGAVPSGSGYTVDGRYLTAPSVLTDLPAAGVGALRGLIQVALDANGAFVQNYRVQRAADPLEIAYARIIGISDDHPLGTFTLLYDNIGGTLSWGGGAPVTASAGTAIRVFDPTGVNWVDLDLVGAAPGGLVTDDYEVNTNLKNDDHLLVGYWYWDGAVTLVLGTDKRIFGNLGFSEMTDDFKEQELHPRWEDLRGNMVYSGGDVTDLGGLTARVEGPIVTYLLGRRYEVAGAYNGVALTPGAVMIPVLNYVYVDETGTLAVSTTDPATGSAPFAMIAHVNTDNVGIISILDKRAPQLFVGQATDEANIWFSIDRKMEWNHSSTGDDQIVFRKAGGADTVNLLAGDTSFQQGFFNLGLDVVNNITTYTGNISASSGDVTANGSVTASTGDVTATAGDVIASNGDVIATLGDIIASAGGVQALAGLIRGLNLTADNDLTVEGNSALKDLVTLGANILGTNANAEVPRLQGSLVDTNSNPRGYTLLGEFSNEALSSAKVRVYGSIQASNGFAVGICFTANARWDNTASTWNRDHSGSDCVKLDIYQTTGGLTIDAEITDSAGPASWTDFAWDENLFTFSRSINGSGQLDLGEYLVGGDSVQVRGVSRVDGDASTSGFRTGWIDHTSPGVSSNNRTIEINQTQLLNVNSGNTSGSGTPMRVAELIEPFDGENRGGFIEVMGTAFVQADASPIAQFTIGNNDASDNWTATIIGDFWAHSPSTLTGGAGYGHIYNRKLWNVANYTGNSGSTYVGTNGTAGLPLISNQRCQTQATGEPNAQWPAVDIVLNPIASTGYFQIVADRMVDDMLDINTEVFFRLQIFSTRVE